MDTKTVLRRLYQDLLNEYNEAMKAVIRLKNSPTPRRPSYRAIAKAEGYVEGIQRAIILVQKYMNYGDELSKIQ